MIKTSVVFIAWCLISVETVYPQAIRTNNPTEAEVKVSTSVSPEPHMIAHNSDLLQVNSYQVLEIDYRTCRKNCDDEVDRQVEARCNYADGKYYIECSDRIEKK